MGDLIYAGNSEFALETGITGIYPTMGAIPFGYFRVILNQQPYGIMEADATPLAISYDDVRDRIARQGTHVCAVLDSVSAQDVAYLYRRLFYSVPENIVIPSNLWELSSSKKQKWSHASEWASDEAFDDGSYILQFDVGERVRLIGFKVNASECLEELQEVWLPSETFYAILTEWADAFLAAWRSHVFPQGMHASIDLRGKGTTYFRPANLKAALHEADGQCQLLIEVDRDLLSFVACALSTVLRGYGPVRLHCENDFQLVLRLAETSEIEITKDGCNAFLSAGCFDQMADLLLRDFRYYAASDHLHLPVSISGKAGLLTLRLSDWQCPPSEAEMRHVLRSV